MNVLALDLGTSSVRAMVFDDQARARPDALARRGFDLSIAADDSGGATLDADEYLAALCACVDELAKAGHLDDIGLVAASAQWHSALPLDAAGRPLGPVVTWLDTRPAPPPGATGPLDPEAFHQRTGAWWHRFYWTVKLPWLRGLGLAPARYTGLVEYVLGELLGEAPMSVSQASGTGLLDLAALDWDPEALEIAGVDAGQVPPLAPPGWQGKLCPEYARRWPQLAAARWSPAIGDGAASNIGSGAVDETRAAVTVGTSAAVRLIQPAPRGAQLPALPHRLWRYRVDDHRVVTGAAYSAGGNLFAWARRELRLPEGAALEETLAGIAPFTGVTADPRLGGDRPPGTAPAGSGELRHIGFGTSATEMFAGLMSGVCTLVVADLEVIESTVDHRVAVTLGGGAIAASPWWRRAFELALAPREVAHVDDPEVGCTGAALAALGRVETRPPGDSTPA
ncbi:FGGY family carbohydrate kinase [Asanoa sp. WMMD1127]|uniref:FGGY family carbohydrate kinase n=1 Tax=Asanoa sp. WMMD1127 TaxID=3016107 RepID=UPI0024168671|nr:FGGY family carbohydrate kinase [Asanoa sp. WMMD1127]MDG4826656.1 FGGY family carbohydrate kinase [Asanoa sp. WMMD1127]